jgi:hypothetical protein
MSRRLTAKFRMHVIALPTGSRFEWRDMDTWAKANTTKSAIRDYDPDDFWADAPWGDLCVQCMVLSKRLEAEGYLIHQLAGGSADANGDYYFRTDKPEPQPWD